MSDRLERERISRQYVTPEILTLTDNKCQFPYYNLTDKFEIGNVEIIYGAFEFEPLPQV